MATLSQFPLSIRKKSGLEPIPEWTSVVWPGPDIDVKLATIPSGIMAIMGTGIASVYNGPENGWVGSLTSLVTGELYKFHSYRDFEWTNISTWDHHFIPNGNFIGGKWATIKGIEKSNPPNEIIKLPNPGLTDYVLEQTGGGANEYEIKISGFEPNQKYIVSCWSAYNNQFDGLKGKFHIRFNSSAGTWGAGDSNTSDTEGWLIETKEIDGLLWEHRYLVLHPNENANMGAAFWYLGYQGDQYGQRTNNPAARRYFTDIRWEKLEDSTLGLWNSETQQFLGREDGRKWDHYPESTFIPANEPDPGAPTQHEINMYDLDGDGKLTQNDIDYANAIGYPSIATAIQNILANQEANLDMSAAIAEHNTSAATVSVIDLLGENELMGDNSQGVPGWNQGVEFPVTSQRAMNAVKDLINQGVLEKIQDVETGNSIGHLITEPTQQEINMYDVNLDGKIDEKDIEMISEIPNTSGVVNTIRKIIDKKGAWIDSIKYFRVGKKYNIRVTKSIKWTIDDNVAEKFREPRFFEDYDVTKDGVLDILDVNIWTERGFLDITEKLNSWINNPSKSDYPLHKPFYFEDYDLGHDGGLNPMDADTWEQHGYLDIAARIRQWVSEWPDTANYPPHRTTPRTLAPDYPFVLPDISTEFDIEEGHERITTTKLNQIKYFSDGVSATIRGSDVYTSSMNSSNHPYYYGITDGDPHSSRFDTQFYIGWGHYAGSGSNTIGNTIKGASEAIYKQYASMVLNIPEDGFYITSGSDIYPGVTTLTKDDSIYVLNFKRNRFKDQLQDGTWTMTLSGSHGGTAKIISLIDDSLVQEPVNTKVGRRYNIISGSNGNPYASILFNRYGWFYPDAGFMIFGEHLKSVIGGDVSSPAVPAFGGTDDASNGFTPRLTSTEDCKNALRFVNCLRNVASDNCFTLYGEKETTDITFACRIGAQDFNFTTNQTILSSSGNSMRKSEPGRMNGFISGSSGADPVSTMDGNPHTFITQVHLHNEIGIPIAIANLSKPIMKNFTKEAVIKVKLSY